jgi:hypothetical protein
MALAEAEFPLMCARQAPLQLQSRLREGTTHVLMSALEFMQRLAARMRRPRLHANSPV